MVCEQPASGSERRVTWKGALLTCTKTHRRIHAECLGRRRPDHHQELLEGERQWWGWQGILYVCTPLPSWILWRPCLAELLRGDGVCLTDWLEASAEHHQYCPDPFHQDGLIWVVDSADRRRLRDCREELAGLLSQEKLAGASVLILANKVPGAAREKGSNGPSACAPLPPLPAACLPACLQQDLDGALASEGIAEALGLGSAAFAKRHWHIQPCSAVTGDGLVSGVDWLVRDIAARVFLSE